MPSLDIVFANVPEVLGKITQPEDCWLRISMENVAVNPIVGQQLDEASECMK